MMTQQQKKRKHEGEFANNSYSAPKRHKTNVKGAVNLLFSAAAAVFSFLIKTKSLLVEPLHHKATVHFPEEIIVHILSRLPVRSLVRFKCVSKSWARLIFDPYFTREHLNCAKKHQKLLINQKYPEDGIYSIYSCPLSPVQLDEDVQKLNRDCLLCPKPRNFIIHSCYDGLALIQINDDDQRPLHPSVIGYDLSLIDIEGYDSVTLFLLHKRINTTSCSRISTGRSMDFSF
ncbi:hypothetical protein P3S67_026772 [Capsicum chacoense]